MKIKDIIFTAMFTALIAVGAFIKIPVPVCPFTMQVFFSTLAGLFLGSKKGALSVLCYIVLGLMGIPVFASGGGPGYIFQPTFGYLLGFLAGTYVTGLIAYKSEKPTFKRLLAAGLAGLAIIYGLGMIYYYLIMTFYVGTGIALGTLFLYCFLMTIPGDIVSCILAAVIGKRLIPLFKKDMASSEA